MKRFSMTRMLLASAAAAGLAATPAAAAIVNLDALTNSGMTATNAISLNLGAGTYTVTPTIGAFTAFTRFNTISGCNNIGGSCTTGYEHSYFVTIGATSTGYGSNNGLGTLGPQTTGGYYATAAQAFALDATTSMFTLAAPQTVKFWIFDDFLSDNSGGVSLNVAAIPEPASWAMLIAGFGLVGAAMRRRTQASA